MIVNQLLEDGLRFKEVKFNVNTWNLCGNWNFLNLRFGPMNFFIWGMEN